MATAIHTSETTQHHSAGHDITSSDATSPDVTSPDALATDPTAPDPIAPDAAGATKRRGWGILADDSGMSTIEYAMGSLAAAALAAALYLVVSSGGVTDAIESIITDALSNTPS